MSTGPSVRVLLFHPQRPLPAHVVEWICERQTHSRVIVPPSLRSIEDLPPRLKHEPFASPPPEAARLAGELSRLLGGPEAHGAAVAEAAVLALLEGGAVVATDTRMFRDLVPLSRWSMNLPQRPTDGLLAQHLGIAGRLPEAWSDASEEALEAVLSGEGARLERVARARRLRARKDGPKRFERLAKTSAGLRPGVVYLDLTASATAGDAGFADRLRGLDRPRALALLSMAAAIFI